MTLAAKSPITAVTISVLGDQYPEFYYVMQDARGTRTYVVGPLRRAGSYELTISATDARGCEATIAPRFVSIAR